MFSPLFYSLEQEAYVVRSSIGAGLTHLRRANLHNRGEFYTAFFQLAIGFERMAKLGIVLDHLAYNSLVPPGARAMKAMGHDLVSLYEKIQELTVRRSYNLQSSFAFSPFGKRILDFLSHFAQGMRYANLDALSSGSKLPTPFTEWEPILHDIITNKLSKRLLESLEVQFSSIATSMAGASVAICSDLGSKPLSLSKALMLPHFYDKAAPHVIWEMLLLLSPMRDFVVCSGEVAANVALPPGYPHSIPYMYEFFEFIWLNRSWQMRRKKWPA